MEKDIGKIRKSDENEIVIRIDEFNGFKGLTIREFTTSERYTGFTKNGTRIPAKEFENFKEMINSINPDDLKNEPKQAPLPTENSSGSSSNSQSGQPSGMDDSGLM